MAFEGLKDVVSGAKEPELRAPKPKQVATNATNAGPAATVTVLKPATQPRRAKEYIAEPTPGLAALQAALEAEQESCPQYAGGSAAAQPPEGGIDSHQCFQQRPRFGSLDGLRCIGILAVIWGHTTGKLWIGAVGVDLFFVISGFLITTLLLREGRSAGGVSLRKFYVRRALRIFPVYYGVLAIYVLGALVAPDRHQAASLSRNLPYFLSYTSNWFVPSRATFGFAWSLATEEQFYCTWPWIEKYFQRGAVPLLAGIIVFVSCTRFGWIELHGLPRVIAISVALPICFGVLLAHLLEWRAGYRTVEIYLGKRITPWIILAVSAALLPFSRNRYLAGVLYALLIGSCVVREDHWLQPVLSSRLFRQIGRVSYGIYLMHGLVFGTLVILGPHLHLPRRGLALFAITTLLTALLASISYNSYEAFFLHFKKHFAHG